VPIRAPIFRQQVFLLVPVSIFSIAIIITVPMRQVTKNGFYGEPLVEAEKEGS
jgi:hypothetical protein